ncbi:UPF0481 protein At3g47200-like [Argentina anserina]|uniref:UPF0481 protein At3g47200-like n=1 Tax=Argentina anserina TaxID=57926 RepID=UPI002176856D|nr:UPF0481 protein At3g47200-like [Potentilla anserina]
MESESSYDEVPHDIENPNTSLLTSMRSMLYNLSPLSSSCCICRVPKRLRRVSEMAYTPQVVSIGPLHHGKEGLKPMEEHKNRYLHDFLVRTNLSMEHYINKIRAREAELRGCYAETIQFNSDEFVRIVLVDAAFIIEVLLRYHFHELQDENDRIFKKPRMFEDVWPDMRMLENQLPFFILKDLFDPERIQIPYKEEKLSIINLSYTFFRALMNIEDLEDTLETISSSTIDHFVDFVRKLYPPPPPKEAQARVHSKPPIGASMRQLSIPEVPQARGHTETPTPPSMTELYKAGVKFKVGSGKNMFDIRFKDGTLQIPKITFSDQSEVNLTNLLVFEQSQCKETENYINDYIGILNILVNTPEDVTLLVKNAILVNKLGDSKKGCTMIKNMGDGVNIVDYSKFHFAPLCEKLNEHCTKSRHKWQAILRQNYFNTPCKTISVIAAACIIIFTLIQTVCSVISVIHDDHSRR